MSDRPGPVPLDEQADSEAPHPGPDAVAYAASGEGASTPEEGEADPAKVTETAGDDPGMPASAEAGQLGPTIEAAAAPSPGTLLREAREARDLDVVDLARTLNLQPRIILALERDDDAALPSQAFVRGYIRSYARLIGLAPEALLAQYDARTGGVVVGVRPSPRIEYAGDSVGVVQSRPGLVMALVTVGVVVVLGAALLSLWPGDQTPEPADASAQASAEPGDPATGSESSPAPAGSAGDADAMADTEAAPRGIGDPRPEPGPAADAPPPAGEGRSQAPTREPDLPAVGAARNASVGDAFVGDAFVGDASVGDASVGDAFVGDASVRDTSVGDAAVGDAAVGDAVAGIQRTRSADGRGVRVFAGGEDHLHFTFTEECWVEVRDADDATVYADLARELESLDLWGRAPFRIRLGYAPAVELTYNGSRVALRPHTRNDVASLVLGR